MATSQKNREGVQKAIRIPVSHSLYYLFLKRLKKRLKDTEMKHYAQILVEDAMRYEQLKDTLKKEWKF